MTVEERIKGAQVGMNQVLIVDATTPASEETASFRSSVGQRVRVEPKTDNEFLLNVDLSEGWSRIEE